MDWAWEALNQATACRFGRFRTEKEAVAQAVRRSAASGNWHTAVKAHITRGERLVSQGRCSHCATRCGDADWVNLLAERAILCSRCCVGELKITLRSLVLG